jgi:hypothetical protein
MFESSEKYQQAEKTDDDPNITDKHGDVVYRLTWHTLGYELGLNVYRDVEGRQLIGSTYQENAEVFWACHWPSGETKKFEATEYKWIKAAVVEWIMQLDEEVLAQHWQSVMSNLEELGIFRND